MKNLFRIIRRRLLSEHKFKTYLFYAIGEVILVVIGILLAIYIDKQQQESILDERRSSIKMALKKDLEKDLLELQEYITEMETGKQELDSLRTILQSDGLDMESLMDYCKYHFNYYISYIPDFNDKTLQSVESGGELAIFDEDIRYALTELSNAQVSLNRYITQTSEWYLEQFNAHVSKYPPNIALVYLNEGALQQQLWEVADEHEFLLSFNTLASAKRLYYLEAIKHSKDYITLSQELMEDYLK